MILQPFKALLVVPLFLFSVACGKGLGPGGGDGGVPGSSSVSLSSISPTSAARGALLTLQGTGFTSATTVVIGGVPCHSVNFISETAITCTAGGGAQGIGDVVVTSGSETATLSGAFTYKTFLFVADPGGQRIYSFSVDASDGALTLLRTTNTVPLPGSVAVDPLGKFLFVSSGFSDSRVAAHSIDPLTGALGAPVISTFTTSAPKDVKVHPAGNFIFACLSGTSPNVLSLALDRATGAVSVVATLGFSNIVAAIVVSPDGRHLYGSFGNAPGIFGAEINETTGALSSLPSSPFGGAIDLSALVSSPNGAFIFGMVTVSAVGKTLLREASTGALTPSAGFQPGQADVDIRAIVTHPTRPFLYDASLTTEDATSYSWDEATGDRSLIGSSSVGSGSADPGAMAIAPGGRHAYVVLSGSDVVVVYRIDPVSGLLEGSGLTPTAAGTGPTGIAID